MEQRRWLGRRHRARAQLGPAFKPRHRGEARVSNEGGFLLVEAMVATVLLVTGLFSTDYVLSTQLGSISSSSQQQTALSLLDQAMEQVSALPWSILNLGLSPIDGLCSGGVNVDPNVTSICSGSTATSATYSATHEVIPLNQTYTQAPIAPHVSSKTANRVTYTVRSYIMEYQNVANQVTRIVVIVSWPSSPGSLSKLSAQTLVNSTT